MIEESLFVESLFTQFKIHHQIAERAIDVPAVALDRRVSGGVDQIDGDGVGVDDVVGGKEGSNLLMAGNHRVFAHVGATKKEKNVVIFRSYIYAEGGLYYSNNMFHNNSYPFKYTIKYFIATKVTVVAKLLLN